ncbi:protein of unknown function [Acidithiobacillus ferrivorans]|uniref:DUF1640 domain-containing protein n=1 Tax=Acidithiobacillus ferrivorans TaxID=160808 RepID=A0A060ULH4_9PROT|nr:hypothetical protein [Acidithiobacillus ferrivorans]CDQ09206.1 hypothetical protein AFERRI_240040 [Acidithiobacillus ferrivorans]SMH64874.1 protein of unknown function [Acidithiobacillus ferrivorans]
MFMNTWKSPVALYKALIEAKVSAETATEAAQSVVEDINTVVANLATKQDLHNEIQLLESRMDVKFAAMDGKFGVMDGKIGIMDGKLASLDSKFDAKFKIMQAYLIIIGILAASSSPLFAPLVQAVAHLLH